MSKYIERIPLGTIERIAIIFGGGRSMAQCKGDADYIMNAGFYSMTTGKPVGHLKAAGKVYAKETWNCFGITWDKGDDIRMTVIPDKGGANYISGTELLTPGLKSGAKLHYPAEQGGTRPRTALALDGESLILYCANTPNTPGGVRDELASAGAVSAIMLDSGGSTQCDFQGKKISSSRRVNNYIAVWLRKGTGEDPEEGKTMAKKVVLDPGHGVETAGKRSPDGTYLEHEGNLDMALRIKAHLERHGVEVVMTRTDEHDVSLQNRVALSNAENPDLFVSVHSNASGSGEWMGARGYGIYTSAAGNTAQRNIAANKIIARVKAAGVHLWGNGLFYNASLYVLKNTKAPAVLIEHLFHDNMEDLALLKDDEFRDLLAQEDAKGILDYLGIQWKEKAAEGFVCPHCGGKLNIVKG